MPTGRATRAQVMRANSLARINMTSAWARRCADEYLTRFREAFGQPAHAILLFDLARGIELVYAIERAIEILSEPLDNGHGHSSHATRRRGLWPGRSPARAADPPLSHRKRSHRPSRVHHSHGAQHRWPSNAPCAWQRSDTSTAESVNMELERAVGRVVRAFDPCIACATH